MPSHKQSNELETKQDKEEQYDQEIFGVEMGKAQFNKRQSDKHIYNQKPVSYTHLTLPTNREV